MAVDGMSFRLIAESEILRKAFSKGLQIELPRCHKGVAKYVHEHANDMRKIVIEKLNTLKQKGVRFGTDTDEYTSIGNKKYATINLHSQEYSVCLGLIRCSGSTPATKYKQLFDQRMESFGIDIKRDIICATTDQASVMVLWGKLNPFENIFCVVHGGHLAVTDVLYPKKKKKSEEDIDSESESGDESDDDDNESDTEGATTFTTEEQNQDENTELTPDLETPVLNVRKMSRMFRKSYTKNAVLQGFVRAAHDGRELKLILDVKTRWSSLKKMLQRFLLLQVEVEMAVLALKKKWPFDEVIIQQLTGLCEALQLIEEAMSRLSRKNMCLVGADAVYGHTINALDRLETPIAIDLRNSLFNRLDGRRIPVLSQLANFLHNHNYLSQRRDVFDHEINKRQIKEFANHLYSRLFADPEGEETQMVAPSEESDDEFFTDSNGDVVQDQSLSNGEKMDLLLSKISKGRSKKENATQPTQSQFENDLSKYERTGEMSPSIEKLADAIKNISVSSVEAERIFSITGSYITKIRSSLGDQTVDDLVFLKKFYVQEKRAKVV